MPPTPNQVAYLAGLAFWATAILVSLFRGGRPERIAAGLLALNVIGLLAFPNPNANVIRWRSLGADVAVLVGLSWLCFRFPRSWLLWACGLQLVGAAVHVPRLVDPHIHNWAYGALVNLSGYTVIVALLAGVIFEAPRHARR